jgi:transposase-like protein
MGALTIPIDQPAQAALDFIATSRCPMKGKAHPQEVKARVIALLLAGATVMEVAAELDLSHQTISNYKREIPDDKLGELGRKKGERLDDLVYQCLITNLETLHQQAVTVREKEYILKQPADQLATLYGVMADKTIRLLAATTGGGNLKQLEAASTTD